MAFEGRVLFQALFVSSRTVSSLVAALEIVVEAEGEELASAAVVGAACSSE